MTMEKAFGTLPSGLGPAGLLSRSPEQVGLGDESEFTNMACMPWDDPTTLAEAAQVGKFHKHAYLGRTKSVNLYEQCKTFVNICGWLDPAPLGWNKVLTMPNTLRLYFEYLDDAGVPKGLAVWKKLCTFLNDWWKNNNRVAPPQEEDPRPVNLEECFRLPYKVPDGTARPPPHLLTDVYKIYPTGLKATHTPGEYTALFGEDPLHLEAADVDYFQSPAVILVPGPINDAISAEVLRYTQEMKINTDGLSQATRPDRLEALDKEWTETQQLLVDEGGTATWDLDEVRWLASELAADDSEAVGGLPSPDPPQGSGGGASRKPKRTLKSKRRSRFKKSTKPKRKPKRKSKRFKKSTKPKRKSKIKSKMKSKRLKKKSKRK